MPSAVQTEVVTATLVPTIDISPFLKDPTTHESENIIETVRNACSETGFFQITGHGVSKEIIHDLFQASKRFFALPMEEKMRLDCRATAGHRGYDVLASQTYDPDVPPDLKEVSALSSGNNANLKHFRAFTWAMTCQTRIPWSNKGVSSWDQMSGPSLTS